MATRKSQQTTTLNGKSTKSEISKTETGFIPLFNKNLPVEMDKNTPVKGTGLLIYQGYKNTVLEWTDKKTEVPQCKPAKSYVFAVKGSDLNWKTIDITVSKYTPGNLYDRLLKALDATDFYKSAIDSQEIIPGFDEGFIFDELHAIKQLEALRGLVFTAELERITTPKGMKVYRINVESLKPVLDKEGNHIRRQSLEETNPQAKTIFSQVEE